MLEALRSIVSGPLNKRAMRKYRSSMGWKDAPKFERFLHQAQQASKGLCGPIAGAAENVKQFRESGVTAIWTPEAENIANSIFGKIKMREGAGDAVFNGYDPNNYSGYQAYSGNFWLDFPEFENLFHGRIGAFLQHYFQSHFKIFYSSFLYSKRQHDETRRGSQLWHNDGGPGTCVILGFFPHATDEFSGCTEVLPWNESLMVYEEAISFQPALLDAYCRANGINRSSVTKREIRIVRDRYYEEAINRRFDDKVLRPTGKAGLTVAFSNNLIHRGGLFGRERYAVLVHCYPSDKPTPFNLYRRQGTPKLLSNPSSPDF